MTVQAVVARLSPSIPPQDAAAGNGAPAERAIWLNGELLLGDAAALQADDHGVLVGDGVFETLLAVNRVEAPGRAAFALRRHLRRLRRSAGRLHFEVPYSDSELRAAVGACLDAAPRAGLVRITVTSGVGPLTSARGDGPGSTIILAGGTPPAHQSGTSIATVAFARNERGAVAGVKTISYAENVVALRQARSQGATEAIFADTQGRVSEGTGSNIFWSDGERLHTPPLDTGCLAGVTRELLLERLGVQQTHLRIERLHAVQEAFLASTTRCVQSVGAIDGVELDVVDGPLTTAASEVIRALIEADIDP